MADLQLGSTFSKRYTLTSDGGAYTVSNLGFRPDYAVLVNLTSNADDDILKAEWYRGMTDAHAFATYVMPNDGADDEVSFNRITANGFTLVENASGVDNSYSAIGAITGATAANPVVITDASHGLSDGDTIRITGVSGMIELNNRRFRVSNSTTNTFEIQDPETRADVDGSNYTAYTSGGQWNLLNRVDANRDVFDPATYDMTLGTSLMAADSDVLQVVFVKYGDTVALGDIA